MCERSIDRETLLRSLPTAKNPFDVERLRELHRQVGRKVIVLDDDPTGTQTVHDIPVITRWTTDDLIRELLDPAPACYVLTNSRSLDARAAVELNTQIAENLRQASARTGRDFSVISRSDSTLRGHFPAELEALESALPQPFDAWVICPFFAEGGRLTIHDVHYVAEGDQLVPAAQTPFAKDAAFGYRNSNLPRWIVEKSDGRIGLDRISSLTIDELRSGDPALVERKLTALTSGDACVVNAASPEDLRAAVHALLRAEASGKRFLYRTGASFVAARSGLDPRPLLEPSELSLDEGRGILVVVGSYVPKTTRQLEHLLQTRRLVELELRVPELLDDSTRASAIHDAAAQASEGLASDKPVVLYTSRQVVGDDPESSLAIGRKISRGLVDLVRRISVRPRAIVGKGGITSSDLATDACEVERALVLGQVLPGVPVWRCGAESRFPNMPLVVFPGNVGDNDAVTRVVECLFPEKAS